MKNMPREKINLSKILLNNKHVNHYTKLLIHLSRWNYYEDYYIPNKKIMNILGINKKRTIGLLKQLEEDHVIAIFYKKRKRFFTLLNFNKSEENEFQNMEDEKKEANEIFNYNWLEED